MAHGRQAPRRLQQKRAPLREQYTQARAQRVRAGKREEAQKQLPGRSLWQLVVSGLLLAAVIGVKLAAPETMLTWRDHLLRWMGDDTDFTEAFSAVGRFVGGDWEQALDDAYVAVFGNSPAPAAPEESAQAESPPAQVYDLAHPPENVELFQQVLGFPFQNPVEGELSSGFGMREHPLTHAQRMHYGLDIAAESGAVIRAFADGTVTAVGSSSDLGEYVTVAHANGYDTLYAHCSKVTASAGQTVRMGDPIAEVGSSGESTGPHLHFELHQDTLYLNPVYYVSC